MNKILIVIKKEWSEVFKNKFVLMAVGLLPLLFTILPLFILSQMSGGDFSGSISDMPAEFMALCGDYTGIECEQYFIISQFLMLFLMMPIIIPVTIASYSIVGEKSTRTLEPLLATPITTKELLTGKALAASIPAVLVTWIAYSVFAIGGTLIINNPNMSKIFLEPLWTISIFWVAPLLAICGVSIAVMISSRVNDPRVAEQLSTLVILPILGIFIAQTMGLIQVDGDMIFWLALFLVALDAILLYFAIQIFQRETILTRWK
jgi:ABC-2 type transport system permease protein